MKNQNKIFAFFAFICFLFSNYFLIRYLYFDNRQISQYKLVQIIIWLNSIFWISLSFLFYKDKIKNKRLSNFIFSMSFLVIIFVSSVTVDRLIGFFLNQRNTSTRLIFEPDTTARYTTTEFDYEAQINSLGLRDREINVERNDRTRILCFGDSWTFGWGVNIEHSWPRVLEKCLIDLGHKVEVINCGQGGQYTHTYKKHMERAVPLLKPDIVLVGVLQGDDLAQVYERHYSIKAQLLKNIKATELPKIFLRKSYENILHCLKNTVKVQNRWQTQSNTIIRAFDGLSSQRYQTFDDSIRNMFESGNLNPGLLKYYMWFPERCIIFNNPDHEATKFAINKMKEDFLEMLNICNKNHSKLVFLNLPTNVYTGHIVKRNPNIDLIFNDYLYNNNRIDAMYKGIAIDVNIPYFELTDIFKSLEPKDSYFFLYDGHPNEKGYNVIGKSIGNFLVHNKFIVIKKEG